jgi:hypothetical protein
LVWEPARGSGRRRVARAAAGSAAIDEIGAYVNVNVPVPDLDFTESANPATDQQRSPLRMARC